MNRLSTAWQRFWFVEIDARPMEWFRRAFACVMLVYFAAWARHGREWLTAEGFHPSFAADPRTAPQLPLLVPGLLEVAFVIFFSCLVLYIVGKLRKVIVWPILCAAAYVVLADPISAFTINRLFVIGFSILALMPEPRRRDDGTFVQIAWPTRLFQVLVVLHYTVAGLCKAIHGDWLTESDVLWTQVQGLYMTDAAAFLLRVLPHFAWDIQQWAALLFELLAALLFVPPRIRPFGIAVGVVMHVIIAVTMDQLIWFSAQMVCFYVLFMPPEWLTLRRRRPSEPGESRV